MKADRITTLRAVVNHTASAKITTGDLGGTMGNAASLKTISLVCLALAGFGCDAFAQPNPNPPAGTTTLCLTNTTRSVFQISLSAQFTSTVVNGANLGAFQSICEQVVSGTGSSAPFTVTAASQLFSNQQVVPMTVVWSGDQVAAATVSTGYVNSTESLGNNFQIWQMSGSASGSSANPYVVNSYFIQPTTYPSVGNWMGNLINASPATLVSAFMLPGAHDAGMYTSNGCWGGEFVWAQTQLLTIAQQLQAGIRYFDLRPFALNTQGNLYQGVGSWSTLADFAHGHFSSVPIAGSVGCFGDTMQNIINQIVQWISQPANSTEFVILDFTHTQSVEPNSPPAGQPGYYGYLTPTNSLVAQYFQPLVQGALGSYLYAPQSAGQTFNISLQPFTALQGKVVTLWENTTGSNNQPLYPLNPQAGVFSDAGLPGINIYNNYSNTNSWPNLFSGPNSQISEMQGNALNSCVTPQSSANAFLLSWTLTAQNTGLSSALQISAIAPGANGTLAQVTSALRNRTYQGTNVRQNGAAPRNVGGSVQPQIFMFDFVDWYLPYIILNSNPCMIINWQ